MWEWRKPQLGQRVGATTPAAAPNSPYQGAPKHIPVSIGLKASGFHAPLKRGIQCHRLHTVINRRIEGAVRSTHDLHRSCNGYQWLNCASRLARNSVPSFQLGQASLLAISRPVRKNTSMSSMAPSTFQLRSYSSVTRW